MLIICEVTPTFCQLPSSQSTNSHHRVPSSMTVSPSKYSDSDSYSATTASNSTMQCESVIFYALFSYYCVTNVLCADGMADGSAARSSFIRSVVLGIVDVFVRNLLMVFAGSCHCTQVIVFAVKFYNFIMVD